jgi:LytS/YehU family sensor histidine kinase
MSEEIFLPLSRLRQRYYAWSVLNDCYSMLWDSYLGLGELDRAIQIQSSWMNIRDSISSYRRTKDILEVNIRYETERKEQEMATLKEDNLVKEMQITQSKWIVAGLVFVVLTIVLIAIILLRQNKLRNEQRTLLLQQRLFRLQMNPHFLYNSLASIQNFIIHKNPSEASSFLSKFSKLVRQILNSSATEYISLDEEINSIENYLSLQKIRYRDMFDYSIDKDEAMDTETISLPPMLAQPFIENSIEHGFKNKKSKGLIHINIKQTNGYFILEIEDNGVGRAKAKEQEKTERKDHKSMATTITTDRLEALNKKLRQKIHFKVIDLRNENGNATGTKVVFEIPLSL